MLLNQMGRDPALHGLQSFITTYHGNPDHPVLQDFLEVMRRFAPDSAAFDQFAKQWFHSSSWHKRGCDCHNITPARKFRILAHTNPTRQRGL